MVQAIITLGEHESRLLNIIKGKFGFRNKSDALNFVLQKFEEELLEPELRPEYIEKLRNIKKQKGISFKSVQELREHIGHFVLVFSFDKERDFISFEDFDHHDNIYLH